MGAHNWFRNIQGPIKDGCLSPAPGQLFHFLDGQESSFNEVFLSFHLFLCWHCLYTWKRVRMSHCGSGGTGILSPPFPSPFALRAALFFPFSAGSGLCSQEGVNSPACPLQTVPHQAPQRLPTGGLHFLFTRPAWTLVLCCALSLAVSNWQKGQSCSGHPCRESERGGAWRRRKRAEGKMRGTCVCPERPGPWCTRLLTKCKTLVRETVSHQGILGFS